ncbi:MAG: hypothetical protein A2Y38_24910 [Spirochaetes bacterium GWB1_59_5]|nr:MAG: hypothetical protein A2Y38_24910 [Spirochaetes bacterium GWB1_59_5]
MANDCENCPDHSGQEERIVGVSGKMTLVLWLLGILITVMIGATAALYSSIQALNYTMANMSGRFAGIEAKLTILEANDQRAQSRLDRLESEKH